MLKWLFKKKKKRRVILRREGEHHNLAEIYQEVNATYFDNKLNLAITWHGTKVVPKTRIRLGSYCLRTEVIRIHRLLDEPHIPRHFVAFIVYHEMLHHVLPPIRARKRRIHHAAFVQRERQFINYNDVKKLSHHLRKTWFNEYAFSKPEELC